MDINAEAIEGIRLLGDCSLISDTKFGFVTENGFKFAAGMVAEGSTLEGLGPDSALTKQCFFGVLTAIYEGAKVDGDTSLIRSALEDCKWPPERTTFFLEKLKEYKEEIRIQISRIGSSCPHIIDVDWRLDYFIKSNQMEKFNEPKYMLSFRTQESDVTRVNSINISCSVDELQDLVGKLKDAAKILEKTVHG